MTKDERIKEFRDLLNYVKYHKKQSNDSNEMFIYKYSLFYRYLNPKWEWMKKLTIRQ
jgi:hypothetical protein